MWLLSIRPVIRSGHSVIVFCLNEWMNEYTALNEWPVYVSAMLFRRCAVIEDSVALRPESVS